jgi:hypothetical protein
MYRPVTLIDSIRRAMSETLHAANIPHTQSISMQQIPHLEAHMNGNANQRYQNINHELISPSLSPHTSTNVTW